MDRETFEKWMKEFVTETDDFAHYLAALDDGTLTALVDDV